MIYGVTMVRNEADIIPVCLRHHLDGEGLDRILIVDDGSCDGTREAIEDLRDPRVHLDTHAGHYRQAEMMTGLARRAYDEGAAWIVVFDADEFWHAPGGLAATLRAIKEGDDSIEVKIENFVQRRVQVARDPAAMLNVVYRPELACAEPDARSMVMSEACSYIEAEYPPKFIIRAGPDVLIAPGNHVAQANHVSAACDTIRCLHVPLRAKDILESKIEQASRLDEAGFPLPHGWHLRRLAAVAAQGGLDREWAANSEEQGHLDTARGRVRLQYDPILAELLKPRL